MARLRGVDGVVPAVLADGKRGGPGGGAGRRIEMDAVEFIRERNRMCKHFRGCAGCPADGMICSTIWGMNDAERLVQIVVEWAEEHPRKTRQSEFLEQYPEARVDKDGIYYITGRKKNIIILDNGENVSPEELENLLSKCEAVKECIVREKGKKICAVIYCGEADQQTVRDFITETNRTLPLYKRMSAVEFSTEPLPRTGTGKLLRK